MLYMLAIAIAVAPVAPRSLPDVVLLSVDTLRADHLGCYGYDKPTSPALDQLAEQALVFTDCVCEAPLTAPSFGSMLSSRYPRMTGLTRNGLSMPVSVPIVPEIFQKAGYQTFCVQSNWTLKAKLCALDRGFDVYEDGFHQRRWVFMKSERYANDVSDIAIRLWKERDPEKPVFMWVHYSDPHAPYRFHRKYNPWGVKPGKLDKRDEVRAQYDSEIAYTDEQISRLLEVLPADAVILFVADHGESLYEHDYLGHGRRIYQAGLQIPLMIRASGVESGRTNVPARGVDIGPTLLGLAGFAPLPGMLGVDLIASPPEPDRIRVVETYGGAVPNLPGAHALMASRPPQRQGALAEGWKLILNGEEREVFYLPEDPMEGKNLAEREPGHAAALDRLIREWVEATPTGEAGTAELSSEDVQALENLGYL